MARKPFGSYTLEERLAVGGMGELYLASTSSDRPLSVVKILHRDFLESDEYVAMFEDEGRIGAQLAHTNIVGVHDTGKVGDVPYIVFEFIDGENLRTVLKACSDVGMPVPPEISLRIIVGVLLGLDHAHRAKDDRGRPMNLVHRDLSPDNIVISWDGEPKILDFGIAKADGNSTHTQVGILKGKSQYMAPEQAKLGVVDQRSDLYSAGVVLLELLTGRKRFDFDDPVRQIIAAQEWTAYKPSDYATWLPAEVDAIVLKALARAPENRFQSAETFAVALTRVLQQGMLPRSEAIASFLRRVFPGRTKRAAVVASDEQTLLPKPGSIPTAARTPMPTVKKAPAFAPPPVELPVEDFDDDRTKAAAPAYNDEKTRGATAMPADEADERTRAQAPRPLFSDDTGEAAAPIRSAFPDDVTGDTEKPLKRTPPPLREADKPTVDASVPPPIIRPPGSTPRPGGGAIRLDIPVEDGVYEPLDPPAPAPAGKSDVRRVAAGFPAVKKLPRSRRLALRMLLVTGLVAAGAGAFSEHRSRLAEVPHVAAAVAWARARIGAATPAPEGSPILVLGSGAGMTPGGQRADPSPTETAGAVSSATPRATTTPTAAKTPKQPKVDAAKPLSATVRVTSDPSGFVVLLDGVSTGRRTPATLLVEPGEHVIGVAAPGFRPWEYEDTFRAGRSVTIPAALIPES